MALIAMTSPSARGETVPAVPLLRISTENSAAHVQTRVIEWFVARVHHHSAGRLRAELHHSADLYRDRDVIKAIEQGKVEMAVPGTWQLDRFAPDVGLFLLPLFYGRPIEDTNRLRDGDIGRAIDGGLERTLGVHVLGRWIDLGFAHIFGVRTDIRTHADLGGLRIRIPGGEANAIRLDAFGARPVIVPWPDLPTALERGEVDGVLTTHETVVSARLWEKGLRTVFEDGEHFAQYIPLVSAAFWERLPPDLQAAVAAAWEDIVAPARAEAAAAQAEARAILQRHGVVITVPETDAIRVWRTRAMRRQDELVRKLGMSPALVNRVVAVLDGSPPP